MIEAILWKHRTGAPWRDLPEEFGPWISVFTRFNRWSKVGLSQGWQMARFWGFGASQN
jgi:transposase